ncbi:MAG: prephenate dehydrogenase/arogenate dehydrogenase family protein [Planctomycetales bacterium]|nr:prephenate dehydrogenase/arogenate dehydrogenase family protein [Planctomycetales bacterium]
MSDGKCIDTLVIVGVGLIGGSIGLAVAQRKLARRIIGVGRRTSQLQIAERRGAITQSTTRVAEAAAEADFVVVCTPVGQIPDHVRDVAAAARPGTIITDAGSTKGEIVRQLEGQLPSQVRFVGSHPLAGGEASGPEAAQADLLADRVVIVTPTDGDGDELARDARRRVCAFWESLGARVTSMSPTQHDATLAATSHLPHFVASALASVLPSGSHSYVGDGWRDTTRIAAGNVELWMQILGQNRKHIVASMDEFAEVIAALRQAIRDEDDEAVRRLLEVGKRNRDEAG